MELEVWKDIKGYEGFYQISNFGRIKRMKRKIIITSEHILKEKLLKTSKITGIDETCISQCINKKEFRITAGGFIWTR